ARELNTYIIVNYQNRYQTELPALQTKFDEAALACKAQINKTIHTCLACIGRNPNSDHSPDSFGYDKVILGVIPAVSDLDNFGNGVKVALEKDPTFFTETFPETVDKIGKEIDIFVTGTIPKTVKNIGKEIDNFFTGRLPATTETVGKRLDKFFTSTIPNLGKTIGKDFKRFGNAIKGLFGLRRRRATSGCPSCDLIDTAKKTAKEIWRDVCGDTVYNIFKNKYTNMVNIFQWLKDGNIIVTQ
ncbi:uncharacterized protein LOC110444355, partial [Mizuhopecten yessoensis]|uniref:uncharacterized protein LOC110444355 n=1 Tax=Mizuhopecten yessoensis TaxID=6573 RepID=UPI000B45833B